MALESATSIAGLISSNPTSGDPVSQGDDHIVLIKSVLKNVFPGVGGSGFAIPLTATEAELNFVHGVTSAIQTQINAVVANAATQLAIQLQSYTSALTIGTSTAYTAAPTPSITTPTANTRLRVKFHLASGATPTLTVGTVTAALQQYDVTGTLVAATLGSGQLTDVEYNGAVYVVLDPLTPVVVAVLPGTIIAFAGTTAPTGYLACPAAASNVSRVTYAALFTAIGTTWGAGDGSTTFGLPFFAADQVPVQAGTGSVGTNTVGSNLAHTHSEIITTATTSYFSGGSYNGFAISAPTAGTTGTSGGTANLAAGNRVQYCIKY